MQKHSINLLCRSSFYSLDLGSDPGGQTTSRGTGRTVEDPDRVQHGEILLIQTAESAGTNKSRQKNIKNRLLILGAV